jgi:hypothetical protein
LDSDVIFRELPDFQTLLKDDICWQSDTSSYLDYNYLIAKEKQGNIPDNLAVKKMAEIGEITPEIIQSYMGKTGGAQYLLKHIDAWGKFSSKLNIDFYAALYHNPTIYNSLNIIQNSLNLKSVYVTDNDLEYFDQIKFKADHPIYIYENDPKASFDRIVSQLYIRQKSISLVGSNGIELSTTSGGDIIITSPEVVEYDANTAKDDISDMSVPDMSNTSNVSGKTGYVL